MALIQFGLHAIEVIRKIVTKTCSFSFTRSSPICMKCARFRRRRSTKCAWLASAWALKRLCKRRQQQQQNLEARRGQDWITEKTTAKKKHTNTKSYPKQKRTEIHSNHNYTLKMRKSKSYRKIFGFPFHANIEAIYNERKALEKK